jgi:hypothetical protein
VRHLVVLIVVGVVTAAAGVAAGGATVGVTARTSTYVDSTGESLLGPDITRVVVSSRDDELTVRVAVPSHPVLQDDMRVRVWLDVDDDRGTGLSVAELRGADRFLLVDRWELGRGEIGLFSCAESSCSGGKDAAAAVRFSYESGATFTVSAGDLGLSRLRRLRFWVEAWSGIGFDPAAKRYDFTNAHADFAPDGAGRRLGDPAAQGEGFWAFESRALVVKSFSSRPGRARAGRRLTLRLGAIRTDTGAWLTKGAISCSAKVAGAALRARTARFVDAKATCEFAIPATARGKSYRATIFLRFAGETVSRSVSGKIG